MIGLEGSESLTEIHYMDLKPGLDKQVSNDKFLLTRRKSRKSRIILYTVLVV